MPAGRARPGMVFRYARRANASFFPIARAAPPAGLREHRSGDGVSPDRRLVVPALAAGVFVCAVLAVMAYAILARIDQGFAVSG